MESGEQMKSAVGMQQLRTERLKIDALCAQNLEEVLSSYKYDSKYIQEVFKQHMMPDRIGYGTWVLKLQDVIIGEASISGPPNRNHEIEIGYHIEAPFRRQGYAHEALKCLLSYFSEIHPKLTVKALALLDNTISQHLLESLNFKCIDKDESYYYYQYEINGVITCV